MPPSLPLRERDRRWQLLQRLMSSEQLDCLIVGSFLGRERYESYITDDFLDGIVVFPAHGRPTVLAWSTTRISRARESESRGVAGWIDDYRIGSGSDALASLIREKGFSNGRIGVVGLGAMGPGQMQGNIPFTFWTKVLAQLPEARFEDITPLFQDCVLVKSEDELALLRYAAQVSEAACQAMLDVTRPGIGEELIYAEVMRAIFAHGCEARYPMMSLQSGPRTIAWGPPRWLFRAEPIRKVQAGDMVQAEIHTCYGGQEAQVQMSIALDPIDQINQRCESVARESFEAGLNVLRPGITIAELVRAMEMPLRKAGCWAKTPLVHTLNFGATGFTGVNREQLAGTSEGLIEGGAVPGVRHGDLVLQPGLALELEPNASLGTHRVNIGCGVIVTPSGAEALNELPSCVRHVS